MAEEILLVLSVGGLALLHLELWVAVAVIVLLVTVVISYRQTCHAYSNGGGAYAVSRANLGQNAALVAAAALLIDYVLTVAVSVAAGVANIVSAVPPLAPSLTDGPVRPLLNKVPEVTVVFWVIKIMATTVGETAADFLSSTLGLGLTGTSVVMAVLLVAALVWQLRAARYVPARCWTAVVLVSVVGTLITDNLTDDLGIPLATTTVVFAVALAPALVTYLSITRADVTEVRRAAVVEETTS